MSEIQLCPGLFPHKEALAYKIDNTGSTMDDARRLSAESKYGLIMADRQYGGRGRLPGRHWLSESAESLLATYWFPAECFGMAPLPMITALAVVRALKAWAGSQSIYFSESLKLKWPNDILLDNGKLAGILCEASGKTIYAGIGLNCKQSRFYGNYRSKPTSIMAFTGKALEPYELARLLSAAFIELENDPLDWLNEYKKLLAWKGKKITFRPGLEEKRISAFLIGIDNYGQLLLADNANGEGAKCFPSGELSILIDD